MTQELRLCANCLYYPERTFWQKVFGVSGDLAKCGHPMAKSLVTGKPRKYCKVMREIKDTYGNLEICSVEGKWWTPRA